MGSRPSSASAVWSKPVKLHARASSPVKHTFLVCFQRVEHGNEQLVVHVVFYSVCVTHSRCCFELRRLPGPRADGSVV